MFLTEQCPPDVGLQSATYSADFRKGGDPLHWSSGGGPITYTPLGAALTINKEGDSPTLTSAWYFFFGRAEVRLRAAPGTGIVSCIVLESDDLDEIDWEWVGGEQDYVQTNYFGKGNTTTYDRGGKTWVADAQGVTHSYAIDWTPNTVTWSIDGAPIRTLAYADALGGSNYPQTPMRLKLGLWAGGDPKNANGTIAWAGGITNYTLGPFTMYLESVSVTNMYPAASYEYTDKSGSWQSITTGAVVPQVAVRNGKKVDGDDKPPTPSPTGSNKDSTSENGDTNSLPAGPKDTPGVVDGVSSVPYPTGAPRLDQGVGTATSSISASRGTPPPNLISVGASITGRETGMRAVSAGALVVVLGAVIHLL